MDPSEHGDSVLHFKVCCTDGYSTFESPVTHNLCLPLDLNLWITTTVDLTCIALPCPLFVMANRTSNPMPHTSTQNAPMFSLPVELRNKFFEPVLNTDIMIIYLSRESISCDLAFLRLESCQRWSGMLFEVAAMTFCPTFQRYPVHVQGTLPADLWLGVSKQPHQVQWRDLRHTPQHRRARPLSRRHGFTT
jgi:hypothetical protein